MNENLHGPTIPCDKGIYEFTTERINVELAAAMAEFDVCKTKMCDGGLSWSEVLQIFVRRAQDVNKGGIGTITVAWWNRKGIDKGRRYSGIFGKPPPKTPLHELSSPSGFCCLSAFALPRGLKYILRTGTGAVDLDLRAAHTQMQLRRLSRAGRMDLAVKTREYYENRDEFLELLQESDWGRRRPMWECKKLLTSLTYGGPVPAGVPQLVEDLAEEQEAIRKFDSAANPERLKQREDRPHPEASVEFDLNEAEERVGVDAATTVARRHYVPVSSFEHDGIVGGPKLRDIIDELAYLGWDFAEKPVPTNWQELLKVLIQEEPDVAWPQTIEPATPGDIEIIVNDPLARALASIGKAMNHVDHEAFARIVISHIGEYFLLESEAKETLTVQWWDDSRKLWVRAGGGRRLQTHVIDICRKYARPLVNGVRGPAPSFYGNKMFFSPICDIVKSYLPTAGERPALDGEQTRGLVRFSCGTVLEMQTGKVRPAKPEDRISLSTGYPYATLEMQRDMKDAVTAVVKMVTEDWRRSGSLSDVAVAQLDTMKGGSKLLHVLFELVGDWDLTLWLLCQITRAIGALPRFEEFLWLSAVSGNNGKGTLVNILQAALGSHNEGYYAQLDFERHFLTGNKINSGNTPDIAALEGKRMVVVNETPGIKHGEINTQLIKRLLSLDAQIQATAKYKDPTSWTSMMHMLVLANECPKFSKDPALFTRLSYLFLPFEFCEEPDPENKAQKALDTTVKENALRRIYNAELFHWAVCLTPYLMESRRSRKILPQPPAVTEDTASHATAAASTRETVKTDLATDFVTNMLTTYTSALIPPSSRDDINKAFCEYAAKHGEFGVNAPEALLNSGHLQNHEGKTRFKMMHLGKNIAIYKKDGNIVTLKTA